jgi:hypothetical protein
MAYDNPGEETDMEDSPSSGDQEATTIIPPELTGGQKFEPGDIIELKVMSVDEDGSLTVKYNDEPEPDDAMSAMDKHFDAHSNDGGGAGSDPTY